jgi:biotin carboxylase
MNECFEVCYEIGFPAIFKPAVSMGGSRGVIFVDNAKDIQEAYKFSTSFYNDKTILVEEFLYGVAHSAEVLIYSGKAHLLAVSDDIKLPLPVCVNKNLIYPTELQGEQRRFLENVIIDAVESLEIKNGYAHIECCSLHSGEIKLFELSSRPGGGGIPDPIVTYLTGVNAFEQYIRICAGEEPEHLAPLYEKGCNYHFITPKPGKIKHITGIDSILSWENILDAALFVHPNDIVNEVRIGSDRAGFIIAGGRNREEALELGYKAEQHITFEYLGG